MNTELADTTLGALKVDDLGTYVRVLNPSGAGGALAGGLLVGLEATYAGADAGVSVTVRQTGGTDIYLEHLSTMNPARVER